MAENFFSCFLVVDIVVVVSNAGPKSITCRGNSIKTSAELQSFLLNKYNKVICVYFRQRIMNLLSDITKAQQLQRARGMN
jgi:hypothetical protein